MLTLGTQAEFLLLLLLLLMLAQDIVEVTRDLPQSWHVPLLCTQADLLLLSLLLLPPQDIVEVTRDLPEALAEFGRVQISRKQVARLIGQVRLFTLFAYTVCLQCA
jgi:hypothetical protein